MCDRRGRHPRLSERHLRCLLASYLTYDHGWRTHLALAVARPDPRPVQPPALGPVIAVPEVRGLRSRLSLPAAAALADAPQPSHYYLALQGRDPEAAVLHRLQRLGPAVHPFSYGRVTARDRVVDRVTGV